MPFAQRHRHPAAASGLASRLRLWSQLWHRYASGDHLDVSGADALAARAAAGRHAAHERGAHLDD